MSFKGPEILGFLFGLALAFAIWLEFEVEGLQLFLLGFSLCGLGMLIGGGVRKGD